MGGWWRAATQVARRLIGLPPSLQFDSTPTPIATLLAQMAGVSGAPVPRAEAFTVMAVTRGRNEICSLATLPIRLYRGLEVVDSPLFRQYDPDMPNVMVISSLIEDLIFDKVGWFRKTSLDFDGYPLSVRYVPAGKVSVDPPKGVPPVPGSWVYIDGERVPMSEMIQFSSPNPGLSAAGARAIRRALLLDKLASTYADNPRPLDYFTDGDSPEVEPYTKDQRNAFLAAWRSMVKASGTVWVPSQVKRVDVNAPSPAELQLVELSAAVIKEIANGFGVDPEDLGVSTTSRTYQNEDARRRDKINRVYAPYMSAITDRLSMGDVTRRGYTVQFDLTGYLKADPATQVAYWQALGPVESGGMGVISRDEIRAAAGWAGPAPAAPAPAAGPALTAGRPPIQIGDITPARARFDGGAAFTFDRVDFAGDPPPPPVADAESRTITGLAVPYGAVATKYGEKFRFLPGSLEYGTNVKHFKDHSVPVGNMLELTDGTAGPVVKLSVLSGPDGSPQKLERDQLLYDAKEGLYNGLSVGVDFTLYEDALLNPDDGVWDVHRATLREVSSTSVPAFDDARVTSVAASLTGGTPMYCQHCGQQHAAGIACATHAARVQQSAAQFNQPAPPTPTPAPGGPPAPAPGTDPAPPQAPTIAQFMELMQRSGLPTPAQIGERAQTVTADSRVFVNEPAPYRFDRKGSLRRGTHDFSTDLHEGWKPGGGGDQAAQDRVQAFMQQSFADGSALENLVRSDFAVTSGNVSALNPNRNRPDMWVDQMEYTYPLWEAINKGTLEDITPFVIPKFSTATGMVANHVEGTEPTPGAYTATAQTITPSAVSGKVEYTREAWDQGGNPQASGLIWGAMVRGYYEALEAYAAAQLAAAAASLPDALVTALAVDSALDQALADLIVPLHYIRGGLRFRKAFTQIDLYKAMAKAKDSAGRRLYPAIGPMNAAGQSEEDYSAIRAHGIDWLPAWALAATGSVAASSYLFDPTKVCGWATAPQRLDITWRVAWVDIGIWGYKAFGITDFQGTREVIYDPS